MPRCERDWGSGSRYSNGNGKHGRCHFPCSNTHTILYPRVRSRHDPAMCAHVFPSSSTSHQRRLDTSVPSCCHSGRRRGTKISFRESEKRLSQVYRRFPPVYDASRVSQFVPLARFSWLMVACWWPTQSRNSNEGSGFTSAAHIERADEGTQTTLFRAASASHLPKGRRKPYSKERGSQRLC